MNGLTNYQKFLVARPLPLKIKLDKYDNPKVNKDNFNDVDWAELDLQKVLRDSFMVYLVFSN